MSSAADSKPVLQPTVAVSRTSVESDANAPDRPRPFTVPGPTARAPSRDPLAIPAHLAERIGPELVALSSFLARPRENPVAQLQDILKQAKSVLNRQQLLELMNLMFDYCMDSKARLDRDVGLLREYMTLLEAKAAQEGGGSGSVDRTVAGSGAEMPREDSSEEPKLGPGIAANVKLEDDGKGCPAQEPDEREQRVAQEQAADAGMEKADITQDRDALSPPSSPEVQHPQPPHRVSPPPSASSHPQVPPSVAQTAQPAYVPPPPVRGLGERQRLMLMIEEGRVLLSEGKEGARMLSRKRLEVLRIASEAREKEGEAGLLDSQPPVILLTKADRQSLAAYLSHHATSTTPSDWNRLEVIAKESSMAARVPVNRKLDADIKFQCCIQKCAFGARERVGKPQGYIRSTVVKHHASDKIPGHDRWYGAYLYRDVGDLPFN